MTLSTVLWYNVLLLTNASALWTTVLVCYGSCTALQRQAWWYCYFACVKPESFRSIVYDIPLLHCFSLVVKPRP